MAASAMAMSSAMPYKHQPRAFKASVKQSMENLIQSQQSEGCWNDFPVIITYVTYECTAAFTSFLTKNSDIKDIVITVLALQFLE